MSTETITINDQEHNVQQDIKMLREEYLKNRGM
jgi:hypothetical protein